MPVPTSAGQCAVRGRREQPARDRPRGAGLSEAQLTHQEDENDRPESHVCGGTNARLAWLRAQCADSPFTRTPPQLPSPASVPHKPQELPAVCAKQLSISRLTAFRYSYCFFIRHLTVHSTLSVLPILFLKLIILYSTVSQATSVFFFNLLRISYISLITTTEQYVTQYT